MKRNLLPILFISLGLVKDAVSHGRLMQPPARNCLWRFNDDAPKNYDDNQLWCGGRNVMINQNKGKCGVCGDSYSDPKPRPHEAGGMFATGTIVRRYAPGQMIDIQIDLTANHQGTFEFKICPVKDPSIEVTQDCLDTFRLKLIDATGYPSDKYTIMSDKKNETFKIQVQLPSYISCSHCILQWTYIAANTWGTCANGTEAVGCGGQETFINCADIAIIQNTGGGRPPKFSHQNSVIPIPGWRSGGKMLAPVITSQVCVSRTQDSDDNAWCQHNCLRHPPNCPASKCQCLTGCEATGSFRNVPGADLHCQEQCLVYPQKNCTIDRCSCF